MPAILKADLKERVAGKRKAWDTEVKSREVAVTKAVGLSFGAKMAILTMSRLSMR
jgi:hypothetical protein